MAVSSDVNSKTGSRLRKSCSELQVRLEPRRLTISGKKETSTEATATLENGVLELKMPKGAQAKTARVEVTAAGSSKNSPTQTWHGQADVRAYALPSMKKAMSMTFARV